MLNSLDAHRRRRILSLTAVPVVVGGLAILFAPASSAAEPSRTGPFCKAAATAVAAPIPDTPDDTSKYTAADKAAQKAYAKILLGAIDTMLKDAPTEVRVDLQAQRKVGVGVAASGVPGEDARPGLGTGAKLLSVVAKNCASTSVALTASDFKFAGMPATVKSGVTAITMKNASKVEMHHLVMFRKANGVTESAKALLDAEDQKKAVFAGFVEDVQPGKTGVAIVNLTPGNYFLSCFLPTGGKETGMPHFKSGMFVEFVVK